uniref:C-type lectin domain-containing protein n=1 Tax=Salarias fasciatus TaxID=181472 RepID=A0A672IG27_SALFA
MIKAVLGAASLPMPHLLAVYRYPPLDFGSKFLPKHCSDQKSIWGEYIVLLHSINNAKAEQSQGSRFISVETKMTWEEAKNYCRSKYTDLAVVRNKEENKEITSLIRSKHWIGLYREVWSSWSDQTPASFTNWAQSQPNTNTSTAMSCAAADAPTGSWWDVDCDEHLKNENMFLFVVNFNVS